MDTGFKSCVGCWCTALLLCILLVAPVEAASRVVRARWVPDGDTMHLVSGEKIRIKGIDCPETSHGKQKAQYYAREARRYLWRLIRGKNLRVDTEQMQTDRFGRLVAYVYLPDGRLVNRVMVEEGYAFCFPHTKRLDAIQKDLVRSQQRAMNSFRGMWARVLRLPVARRACVGNRSSRRFHLLTCPYGKKIRLENRVTFSTLRQAFYAGYAPCRSCTPWPGQ